MIRIYMRFVGKSISLQVFDHLKCIDVDIGIKSTFLKMSQIQLSSLMQFKIFRAFFFALLLTRYFVTFTVICL